MANRLVTKFMIAAVAALPLVSCEKNEEPPIPDSGVDFSINGIYVLNQGNFYKGIEGSFNVLDFSNGTSVLNVFQKTNNRSIGATPQCGTAHGSKIYIGVYESNTIEVIDRNDYKSIKQISCNSSLGSQPRSMVAEGGYVYISMFDGYVARLDTVSLEIDASVAVGPNPEIMASKNGKLYVPNSDGLSMTGTFGKIASIIDMASFTVERNIEVPQNPVQFFTSNNGVFLLCNGNYYDENAKIYKVNDDYSVTAIDDATVAEICGDYICYVNDPFYGSGTPDYKKYNIQTGEISDWTIERPEYANTIYYDKVNKNICIYSLKYYGGIWPSYELPGYVAVYDENGKHLNDYAVGTGPACLFQ